MNSSEDSNNFSTDDEESNNVAFVQFVVAMVLLSLSSASVIFGIVSWIVLPKWRLFRHYVFVAFLLNYSLGMFLVWELLWTLPPVLLTFLAFTDKLAFAHWLMIATVMFYFDFVRVFTHLETTSHLYLKANIFGWVLPIVWTVVAMFSNSFYPYAGMYLVVSVCIVLMSINFILYLCVLYALFKEPRDQRASEGIGKKVTLSTFAFVCTGSVYSWPFLITFLKMSKVYRVIVFNISYFLTILCLNVFFLMLKSHRDLWAERLLRAKTNII